MHDCASEVTRDFCTAKYTEGCWAHGAFGKSSCLAAEVLDHRINNSEISNENKLVI